MERRLQCSLSLGEPPVEPTVAAVLTFFGAAVADGTLVGNGPGNSADGRKGALRNQIEAAGDLISEGYMDEACEQLMNAYLRCDGLPTPPEFVAGPAAPTLAGMILDLPARPCYARPQPKNSASKPRRNCLANKSLRHHASNLCHKLNDV